MILTRRATSQMARVSANNPLLKLLCVLLLLTSLTACVQQGQPPELPILEPITTEDYRLYNLDPLATGPSADEGLQVTWLQTEQQWQDYAAHDPALVSLYQTGFAFLPDTLNQAVVLEWQGPSNQQLVIQNGLKSPAGVLELGIELHTPVAESDELIQHRKLLMLEAANQGLFSDWPRESQPTTIPYQVAYVDTRFYSEVWRFPSNKIFTDSTGLQSWLSDNPSIALPLDVNFDQQTLVFLSNSHGIPGRRSLAVQSVVTSEQSTVVNIEQKISNPCFDPHISLPFEQGKWLLLDALVDDIQFHRQWSLIPLPTSNDLNICQPDEIDLGVLTPDDYRLYNLSPLATGPSAD